MQSGGSHHENEYRNDGHDDQHRENDIPGQPAGERFDTFLHRRVCGYKIQTYIKNEEETKNPARMRSSGVFSDSNRPPTSQAFAILIKSIIFANHIVAIVSSC